MANWPLVEMIKGEELFENNRFDRWNENGTKILICRDGFELMLVKVV